MEHPLDRALVWVHRDLRADDHAALHHALAAARRVWCVFVFDTAVLEPLPRADRRVEFILDAVRELDGALREGGGGLIVRHGPAVDEIARLAAALRVQAVYCSHDDDPATLARDAAARGRLADLGIALHTAKDHVVFERSEVMTLAGSAYTVFTPYKTAWLRKLEPAHLAPHAVHASAGTLAAPDPGERVPTLAELGFERTNLRTLELPTGTSGAQALLDDFLGHRIDRYHAARDFPAVKGPSYLGAHLRFGTISVRRLAREAWERLQAGSRGAEVWLSELVWREFFQQVLHHHPHVAGHAFKREYDKIRWEGGKHAQGWFEAWCAGRTGYPLIDAAMRQLLHTGWMHNRLRMVTASFLVKDLGIDWRRGEAWFALHLLDFELGSNNGGWQWAASTGCDAQPYFRIFNPVAQSEKFDPEGKFIRRYVPELAALPNTLLHAPWLARPVDLAAANIELGRDYPQPIVRHEAARLRTMERYGVVNTAKRFP
jgi:deoxyribodipyrimidine photo-lyase